MRRRLTAVIMILLIVSYSVIALANDYSFLEGMTLEELEVLKKEIDSRINQIKEKTALSDTQETGIWIIKNYVDEFNNYTDEQYITTKEPIKGTFNTMGITNGELSVTILIDLYSISFKLKIHSLSEVKSAFMDTNYKILMLDSAGQKTELSGVMYKGGDRVFLIDDLSNQFLQALLQGGAISFRIIESDNELNNYYFKIEDASYFQNVAVQIV